jgi:hypothetical protein
MYNISGIAGTTILSTNYSMVEVMDIVEIFSYSLEIVDKFYCSNL